jgi:hypothetical protein
MKPDDGDVDAPVVIAPAIELLGDPAVDGDVSPGVLGGL